VKQIVRNGKTITVFDNVEELKWFYHARLCKDSGDPTALLMTRPFELFTDEAKILEYLKKYEYFCEPCEVKEE
jgi:hypothetical protein